VQGKCGGSTFSWKWQNLAGTNHLVGCLSSADCGTLGPGAGPQSDSQGPLRTSIL
jgi:hypothetical protein